MQAQMRPSRVLKIMKEGKVANCIKVNLSDSRALEIAAMSGFDCIWTDMEHVANDWQAIENQIVAAKCYDVDLLVRVSRGGYSDYIRPLELDAAGIMVPHIMNLEDAKNVIKMTRFHPLGRRPVDGGNADGKFTMIDFKEYIAQANTERFVIVQIEDPEPLEDLDEIISLDGIDMLFFGPGDFSQGIGDPGNFSNPLILETRRRIAKTCRNHGKFAGTVGSVDNRNELMDEGYQFISLGADVVGLVQYYENIMTKVHKETAKRSGGIYGGEL